MLERLVDEAARIRGIDPVKLRRRNLIRASAIPPQDRDRHDLRFGRFRSSARQGDRSSPTCRASSSANGKRPSAANIAAWACRACSNTPAVHRLKARRSPSRGGENLNLVLNVQSTGQGHAIAFPPIIAQRLEHSEFEKIGHRHGDSCQRNPRHGVGRFTLGDDSPAARSSRPSTPCWRRARPSPPPCSKRPRPTSTIAPATSKWSAPTLAASAPCSISPPARPR